MSEENMLHFSLKFAKQKEYWIYKLNGEITESEFLIGTPKNRSQEALQIRERMEISFIGADDDLSPKLLKLSKKTDLSLYIILLAALKSLIYRYTGKEDIICQAPVYEPRISEDTINNCLFIRNQITGATTFKDVILSVKQSLLEAHAHQDYPSEKIIEYLFNTPQEINNNSLSNIVCSLSNIHDEINIERLVGKIAFLFHRDREQMNGYISYNPRIYDSDYVRQISRHFIRLLAHAIEDVNTSIAEISILTEQEKKQLLVDFNSTRTDYPRSKTIQQLFEEQVEKTPNKIAVVGSWQLAVGGASAPTDKKAYRAEESHAACRMPHAVTYSELNDKSNQLAHRLKSVGLQIGTGNNGTGAGTAVGIVAHHSIEAVIGILAILKAGGAYLSVDPDFPQTRKEFMFSDGNLTLALAQSRFVEDIEPFCRVIDLGSPDVCREPAVNLPAEGTSDDLAYIIYTSGSTGTPKGVMVEHKSVVRLVKNTNYIQFTEKTRLLQTGAMEFDASTFEIWGCLLNGSTLYLIHKDYILVPYILKEVLLTHEINLIWMASGLFNQMFDTDVEMFKCLRHLVVGGDVLSAYRINKLRQEFPSLEVINGYGPTENTTFSACFSIHRDYESNIPIGKPISNTTAYIIDKANRLQPVGAAGHLCFSGDGLARGYVNNIEFSAEKFVDLSIIEEENSQTKTINKPETEGNKLKNDPLNKKFLRGPGAVFLKSAPGRRRQKIYRTGDLARWLADGTIEFLGRIDHQIKLRGYRIEPGEIENHLLAIDYINECVVTVFQEKAEEGGISGNGSPFAEAGEKYLCAYVTANRQIDSHELRERLLSHLPDYMVPTFFVPLKEIPLTSNGKVDRLALPKPEFTAGKEYIAPRSETEKKLVQVFAEVLNINEALIGIDSNFFDLGGHSLKAIKLIARIHKELNIKIQLTDIFEIQTIRGLAELAEETGKDIYAAVHLVEKSEYYPLSSAQKRMYILQQMNLTGTMYNVTLVMPLQGNFNEEKVQETFQQLILRHESFRTSFRMVNGETVQKIVNKVEFQIEYHDLTADADRRDIRSHNVREIAGRFVRAFDLSRAPLLRVGLVKSSDTRHIFMVDMHHIVSDGTSINIIVKDFISLYTGKTLPPLRLQYKDYSQWQNSLTASGKLEKQEVFWLQEFETLPPVLELPTDYPRPPVQYFEGGSINFVIGNEETKALNELLRTYDTTMFMVLLAVFNVFLFKLSGQEDIVVGTPVACRSHADLENIVGMFVNTLALRNQPSSPKPFVQFLKEIREKTMKAFENQEYQLEDLVGKLETTRDSSRNPLFDVTFGLQNQSENLLNMNPEVSSRTFGTSHSYDTGNLAAKFDISLAGIETGDTILFNFEYSTRLFKKETITRFIDYLQVIITDVLKNPGKEIKDIDILSDEAKRDTIAVIEETSKNLDIQYEF
jgi:tyrocidine synthetase-3